MLRVSEQLVHHVSLCYTKTLNKVREFIDYTTSMITDSDPLWRLLFCYDVGFSYALHVLKGAKRDQIQRF